MYLTITEGYDKPGDPVHGRELRPIRTTRNNPYDVNAAFMSFQRPAT
jgi:hypothetical protein